MDIGVGCAGGADGAEADGPAVECPAGGVAVPLLLSHDALLCPATLHFWHLITVPTLDIFVAFGCS